jgi:hypothetical protein
MSSAEAIPQQGTEYLLSSHGENLIKRYLAAVTIATCFTLPSLNNDAENSRFADQAASQTTEIRVPRLGLAACPEISPEALTAAERLLQRSEHPAI